MFFYKINYLIIFILFCLQFGNIAIAVESFESAEKSDSHILRFKAGIYELDQIVLDQKFSLLEGVAPGVTILKVKNGIIANAPNPVLRNFTLIGYGEGIGIRGSNIWRGRFQDLEIENYQIGMQLELTEDGRKRAVDEKTSRGWPSDLSPSSHWGSRVTLTEIRNVAISGPGDGIVLRNYLKNSNKKNYFWPSDVLENSEFFTATTIVNGHIFVDGRALIIGDGVIDTKVFGLYIDISPGGGILAEYGANELSLIGVTLDLNWSARPLNIPHIIFPKKVKDSLRLVGVTPSKIKVIYSD